MEQRLTASQTRLLGMIFARGAENASQAMSRWLGQPVHLELGEVEQVEIAEATEALGPGDSLVACCAMTLAEPFSGQLLLVFDDRSGLALADLLLRQPLGATTEWSDLPRSAALETANIVGCAYLNALSAHLPSAAGAELIPSPPTFRHEFAASLLQFALLDQAVQTDQVLLIHTRFHAESLHLDWSLLFAPTGDSLSALALET
jgi:chemotaxis protein CheC